MGMGREIKLLTFHVDLFKRYLCKITVEPDVRQKIQRFEISVAEPTSFGEAATPLKEGMRIQNMNIGTPSEVLYDVAQGVLYAAMGKQQPGNMRGGTLDQIDPKNMELSTALACFLVESYIESSSDFIPCSPRDIPRTNTADMQDLESVRATGDMVEHFREISKFPGMGYATTASLLMSAWISVAGSSSEDQTGGFFSALEAQAKTIRDRQNLLKGDVDPKKLAELIRSISFSSKQR